MPPQRWPWLASLLLLAVATFGLLAPADRPEPLRPESELSLLAVGDTGTPRQRVRALDPGLAVAEALAAEDRAAPVDGLLLLGDNFYPDGLRERELDDRVRQNVVEQFCRFVRLTAPGRDRFADACPLPAEERHPMPIYALLGNHDYTAPESPRLQRNRIPEYVENWDMPTEPFEVRELPGGVSLILLESMRWVRGAGGKELIRAVRLARGPWRIVAAHHPMVDIGDHRVEKFERRIGRLLTDSKVRVHLFVAGHEHNLQVLERPGEWPPLHVVSGSGSTIRELTDDVPGRRFASAAHGFARVDVQADPARIVTTLYEVATPTLSSARGRPVARFSVDPEGRIEELPLARE